MFRSLGYVELLIMAAIIVLMFWPWAKILQGRLFAMVVLRGLRSVRQPHRIILVCIRRLPVLKRLRDTTPGKQAVVAP
jgi:hypothetical protein